MFANQAAGRLIKVSQENCPWLETFEEHGAQLIVGFDESHRRVSVPEAQPFEFVLTFQ